MFFFFQKNLEVLRRSKMTEAELEELERKESEVPKLNPVSPCPNLLFMTVLDLNMRLSF